MAHTFSIQIPGFVFFFFFLDKPGVPASLCKLSSRLRQLLQSVLQSRELRSGKSRVLPASGNSPHPPSSSASTGHPHESGSGSPKDFTNAWPVPSIAQLGGLSAEEGGPSSPTAPAVLGLRASGSGAWGQKRVCVSRLATAVVCCRPSFPLHFTSQIGLSQGARRKFPFQEERKHRLAFPKVSSRWVTQERLCFTDCRSCI